MTLFARHRVALAAALVLTMPVISLRPANAQTPAPRRHLSATEKLWGELPSAIQQQGVLRLGQLAANRNLVVTFGLPLRHEPELDWFISHEAVHGRYLTQSQFDRRFAPPKTQVDRLEAWALGKGMRVIYASPDGLVVTVRVPAQRIENALHVRIRRFVLGGKAFFANTSAPLVPRALGIQTVTGLNDVNHAVYVGLHSSRVRKLAVPGGGYTPRYLRLAYDISGHSVNGSSVDGTGQTVGITGFGQKVPDKDLTGFAGFTGDPPICSSCTDKVQWFLLDGTAAGDSDILEQALDVEYIHGLALHSHIKYWLGDGAIPGPGGAPDGSDASMEDAVAAAANDASVHVVSNSWTYPGIHKKTDPFVTATTNSFKHAVAVGTTFYFSTGDNAANSGCVDVSKNCGLAIYPASSPLVVAVGGTNLQMNSAFTSWASEATWNLQSGDESGSGGGCTNLFRRPVWQVGVKAATCPGRPVPDISAAADLDNSPVQVWVDGGPEFVGGTSVSASLISGMAADTQRYLALEHAVNPGVPESMGFATPEIYRLATSSQYNAYFHDVLCGSNTYPAGPGWDQATGWGSIDWYQFSRGYAGQQVAPVPPAASWSCDPETGTSQPLSAVACPAKYRCYLGGASGTLLKSIDGWHWSTLSAPSNATVLSIACSKAQICFTLSSQGSLRKTTDGGLKWGVHKVGIGSPAAVACPSSQDCYVVGDGIAKTSNGSKFIRQADPAGGSLIAVSCPGVKACYASRSNGTILRTQDGSQWSLSSSTPPAGTISALSCPRLRHCMAVGTASTPDTEGGTALVYSTSDGVTWTSQVIGPYGPLSSVSCFNASTCDATTAGGLVLRTTDGGAIWTQVAPFSAGNGGFDAVACPAVWLCYAAAKNGHVLQLGASRGQK
jgi:photosystem II stability/assembly factor-like uncharacterized protein